MLTHGLLTRKESPMVSMMVGHLCGSGSLIPTLALKVVRLP